MMVDIPPTAELPNGLRISVEPSDQQIIVLNAESSIGARVIFCALTTYGAQAFILDAEQAADIAAGLVRASRQASSGLILPTNGALHAVADPEPEQ